MADLQDEIERNSYSLVVIDTFNCSLLNSEKSGALFPYGIITPMKFTPPLITPTYTLLPGADESSPSSPPGTLWPNIPGHYRAAFDIGL